MKHILKSCRMPLMALVPGIAGYLLRSRLYATGPDIKNLLPRNHPLTLALWALTALTAVLILAAVRRADGPDTYEDNFRPSFVAALGHILAASGILLTVLTGNAAMAGPVGAIWKPVGILCAPLLTWAAFCRAQGKRPFFLTHAVLCVFLVLHLVNQYQTWCSNPQLQDYLFDFLGAICLMLHAYHQAEFDTGSGHRRMLLATGLMGGYLCFVSLACTPFRYLYLFCGIWALTGLCLNTGSTEAGGCHDAS